jgi:uncharacterized DUF497 family protein
MCIDFEWDEEKNAFNKKKHKITFEEAEKVFLDPKRFETIDKKHSFNEERLKTVGFSGIALLSVVFTERDSSVRIITARKADKREEEEYFYGYS